MIDLQRFTFHKSPFEYFESKQVFKPDILNSLSASFPNLKNIQEEFPNEKFNFTKGVNRIDINTPYFERLHLTASWKQLIHQTTSLAFFHTLCEAFNIDSTKYCSMSKRTDNQKTDVTVDFQFAYNTKNNFKKKQFIRQPHVDSPDKIFVILMYFPENKNYDNEKDYGYLQLYNDDNTFADKIDYCLNSAIIFKNNNKAYHAPFALLNHPDEHRRFLNIIFMDNTH